VSPHVLGIPFVVGEGLLRRAVDSVAPLWPSTVIIDNSDGGLDAAAWPVDVVRPAVPLSFSQTMNLLQALGRDASCEAVMLLHSDAAPAADAPARLLATLDEASAAGRRWGIAFTAYDAFAAYSAAMIADVGPWDVTLPQYFADIDYYRRVRLAGWEVLETGLPVLHDASSTIRLDEARGRHNAVTFPLYEQYYAAKWGGAPGRETFERPFDRALLEHLRAQPLYRRLRDGFDSVEGNLLEVTDDQTATAQVEALQWAIARAAPRAVLETGTNKGYFGYLLAHITRDVTLHTFDGDPRCERQARILNEGQARVRVRFTLGDTKQTLAAFAEPDIGFAWIDGGHDEATAASDIGHAMRLGVPLIAVDDTLIMGETARAVDSALAAHKGYQRLEHPFAAADSRGIALLAR
jgi:predicted O-methyltransferase YrrM